MHNDKDSVTGTEFEMQECECCPAVVRIEDALACGDIYMCPQCYREALEAFHNCQHNWKPDLDEFGDPARSCRKCGGLVAQD